MLSLPVRDCTNGYRGYRREVIQNLNLDKIKSNGYSFLIEVLYESHKKGYLLAEVPTVYVDRQHGKSKLSWKVIIEAFLMVVKMSLGRIFKRNNLP